jgi:hypothetical protein
MGRRGNWDRLRLRKRMQRSGTESVGSQPPLPPQPTRLRRRKLTKAELRAEAERALADWKVRHS